jgi:ComF family protein
MSFIEKSNVSENKGIMHQMGVLFNDFLGLIYPNLCLCCENSLMKQENFICSQCEVQLPRSHFHLVEGNPVEQLFWGRVAIVKASSYFIYKKGSRYQRLMQHLKYKGLREIGVELGRMYGAELQQNSFFDDVEVLIPVPLHPKKERKRGYNQSAAIAEGLASSLQKQVNIGNLYRKQYNESQTRRGRYERWENVSDLFDIIDPGAFEGRHVLLVDDVVTTGSTLEACANALLKCNNTKVSIATLAYASI